MSTFKVDYSGFQHLFKEFIKAIPITNSIEQLQAGSKCLMIAYVNMGGTQKEIYEAEILLSIAERKLHTRERELLLGPLKK